MDEMTGLTSEISEELDKSCSGASVTNEVEVAMVAPEVTVVAPEESLESAPIVNGDGKSVEVGGWGSKYLWVWHGRYVWVWLLVLISITDCVCWRDSIISPLSLLTAALTGGATKGE